MDESGEIKEESESEEKSRSQIETEMDVLLDSLIKLTRSEKGRSGDTSLEEERREIEMKLSQLSNELMKLAERDKDFQRTVERELASAEIIGEEGAEKVYRKAQEMAEETAELVSQQQGSELSSEKLKDLRETTELSRKLNLKLFVLWRIRGRLNDAVTKLPIKVQQSFFQKKQEIERPELYLLNPGENTIDDFQKTIAEIEKEIDATLLLLAEARDQQVKNEDRS